MKVSVVICTRNRAHSIIHCLDSIETAARAASLTDAEIVVVDNASTDNTSTVVSTWAQQSTLHVILEHEPRPGITIAKNRGLRSARGDLLVLTDDDCRLRDDYFIELFKLEAAESDPVLRGGRVELGDPADLPLTIKTDPDRRRWHLSEDPARHENLGNCFYGCNISMRRAVYERLGPFDEHFAVGRIPAGEDIDYIFRAYVAGIHLEYAPDIVLFHYHGRREKTDAQKLMYNYMIGSGALYAKHLFRSPAVCRELLWDIKNLFRETFARKNLYLPAMGFSYKDKVRCYISGAWRYLCAVTRQSETNRS